MHNLNCSCLLSMKSYLIFLVYHFKTLGCHTINHSMVTEWPRVDSMHPLGQQVSALNEPLLIWGQPDGPLALLLWVGLATQWVDPAHSHLEFMSTWLILLPYTNTQFGLPTKCLKLIMVKNLLKMPLSLIWLPMALLFAFLDPIHSLKMGRLSVCFAPLITQCARCLFMLPCSCPIGLKSFP